MKKVLIIVSSLLLACCSNVKSEVNDKEAVKESAPVATQPTVVPTSVMAVNNDGHHHDTNSTFKPNFISAASLLKKVKANKKVYIFDVRNKESYDESHIKTALSTPIPITAEAVKGIPKDAEIVTYCGCPHHLSAIGAEQLTKMGYKNVAVLNEGFWFWRDNKYPLEVDKNSKSTISMISVEGKLTQKNQPMANMDIYLRHEDSGQLEATRTDMTGTYKMNFHLYNYKNKDKFKFFVGDLQNPVQDFSTDKKITKDVLVRVP